MSRLEDGEVLNCSQAPNSRPDHLPVVTDQVRNRNTCQRTKLRKNSGFIVCSEVRLLLIHLKYPALCILSSSHWAKTWALIFSGNRLEHRWKNRDKHKHNEGQSTKTKKVKDSQGNNHERREEQREKKPWKTAPTNRKEKHLKDRQAVRSKLFVTAHAAYFSSICDKFCSMPSSRSHQNLSQPYSEIKELLHWKKNTKL